MVTKIMTARSDYYQGLKTLKEAAKSVGMTPKDFAIVVLYMNSELRKNINESFDTFKGALDLFESKL